MRSTPLEANGNSQKAEAMQRIPFPVMTILALNLLAVPNIGPAAASTEGATTILYSPTAPDAKAFVFDVRMSEANECMIFRYSGSLDPGESLPWVASEATRNGTILVAGKEVLLPDAGGYGAFFAYRPQDGDGHALVNVSAGGLTVFRSYQATGYDHENRVIAFAIETGVCDLTCQSLGFVENAPACDLLPEYDTVGTRLEIVMTPHVRNASVVFNFYEQGAFNWTSNRYEGTHGAARGWVTFASESNRTFLRQLKDFEGTASYNGDPLSTGMGPSSAGANLQATVTTTRGMIGGFADGGLQTATDLLSYVGPQGEVGGISDGPHFLSPPRMMTTFEGSPGKWAFNAHAYANPDYATLFLWGADIDTE